MNYYAPVHACFISKRPLSTCPVAIAVGERALGALEAALRERLASSAA